MKLNWTKWLSVGPRLKSKRRKTELISLCILIPRHDPFMMKAQKRAAADGTSGPIQSQRWKMLQSIISTSPSAFVYLQQGWKNVHLDHGSRLDNKRQQHQKNVKICVHTMKYSPHINIFPTFKHLWVWWVLCWWCLDKRDAEMLHKSSQRGLKALQALIQWSWSWGSTSLQVCSSSLQQVFEFCRVLLNHAFIHIWYLLKSQETTKTGSKWDLNPGVCEVTTNPVVGTAD